MGAKLQWTDHMGQSHELMMGPELPVVIVGRMADCQIRVVETSVSRRHSQVSYQRVGNEEVYEFQDLGSSNGSFVNDQQIQRQRLSHNDTLRCGNFAMRLIMMASAPAPMHQPPGMGGYGPPPGAGMQGPPGPPQAGAATGYGPSRGSAPPSSGAPYLDDPSIAISPGDIPSFGPPGGHPRAGNESFETFGYGDLRAPGPPPSSSGTYDGPPAPAPYPSGGGGGGGGQFDVPSHLSPDQLRAELGRALRRNDALARELDGMRQGSHGANYESMRRSEQEATRFREETDHLRIENEEMRTETQRSQAQIDSLSDRNMELKEQFTKLQETQSELRDRLKEAREDLDNALFKRDELQTDVERLEKDKVDLFDQLTKLKIEYNHLERSHEQVQKEHNLLEFEYKRLDENNQELERELRSTLEGDTEQIDSLNKLQSIVDEKENVIDELRERLETMKQEMAELDTGDEVLMRELENLKNQSEVLRGQKEGLERRFEELRAEQSKAVDLDGLEDELVDAREEIERLRRKLKETVNQAAFENVQTENEELRRDLNRARDQLATLKEETTSSGAEEMLTQIRELQAENRRMQARMEDQATTHSTSPGSLRAVKPDGSPVNLDKVRDVFNSLNGMVSGWRANLEAVQIQVGDLSELFGKLGEALESPISDGARDGLRTEFDEIDPEWACESMTETVRQILSDSKQIKNMLLELRDTLD